VYAFEIKQTRIKKHYLDFKLSFDVCMYFSNLNKKQSEDILLSKVNIFQCLIYLIKRADYFYSYNEQARFILMFYRLSLLIT